MEQSYALRVAGIFVLTIASFAGVTTTLGLLSGNKGKGGGGPSPLYLTARCFAAGIMLGVALMHLLDDAYVSLIAITSGCEDPEGVRVTDCAYVNFPALATTMASVGALMVVVAEQAAISTLTPSATLGVKQVKHASECDMSNSAVVLGGGSADCTCEPLATGMEMQTVPPVGFCDDDRDLSEDYGHDHSHVRSHDHDHDYGHDHSHVDSHVDGHGHNHSRPIALALSGEKNDMALLVKAFVMEISIALHSIIIGVAFGALGDVTELVGLLAALAFHQFFEGIALGASLQSARAQLGERKIWTFALIFALTTPMGILIGLFALPTDEAPSDNQAYAQGILNAIAAGNLIYIALVEMVSVDFRSPLAAKSGNLRAAMIVALLAGDLCMAILALWA